MQADALADIFAQSLADTANWALGAAPEQAPAPAAQGSAAGAQVVLAAAAQADATPSARQPGSLPHDAQGGRAVQTTESTQQGAAAAPHANTLVSTPSNLARHWALLFWC